MYKSRTVLMIALLAFGFGCDGTKKSADSEAAAPEEVKSAAVESDKPVEEDKGPPPAKSLEGFISFKVDGEQKKFEYLSSEKNIVSSLTTNLHASPKADVKEGFTISLVHFDARKSEYPRDLELNVKFDPKRHKSAADVAKDPKPLVGYTTPEGLNYGRYVKLTLDSYEGGVLKGHVKDEFELSVRKPKDSPRLKISDVKFEAKLDAPVPKAIDKAMGESLGGSN